MILLTELQPVSGIITGSYPTGLVYSSRHDLIGHIKGKSILSRDANFVIQSSKLNAEGILAVYDLAIDHEEDVICLFEQHCNGIRLDQLLDEKDFLEEWLQPIDIWRIVVGVSLAIVKLLHNYKYKGLTPYAFFSFSEKNIYYASSGRILYRPAHLPHEELRDEKNPVKAEQYCIKQFGRFISMLTERCCRGDLTQLEHLYLLVNKMTGEESARPTFAAICALENLGEHIRTSLIEADLINSSAFLFDSALPWEAIENTPLFDAIEREDPAGIYNTLEWMKRTNLKGRTALMHAAVSRLPLSAAANLLIGSEACCQDSDGWTALMHAIDNQYYDLANLLLEREAGFVGVDTAMQLDVSGGSQLGSSVGLSLLETPAAPLGRSMAMRMLGSSTFLNATAKSNINGAMTALILAVRNRQYAMAKYLAPYEAGYQDGSGRTALMYALQQDDYDEELCTILAAHDGGYITTNGADDAGFAFQIAAMQGKRNICQLLIDKERNLGRARGFTSLHYAVAVHDDAMFNSYLQKYLCARDAAGVTPLMLACIFDDAEYFAALVDTIRRTNEGDGSTGAVIDEVLAVDVKGFTTSDYAITNCSYSVAGAIVKLLAEHSGTAYPLNDAGVVAVIKILANRNTEVAKLLTFAQDSGILLEVESSDMGKTNSRSRLLGKLWFRAVEAHNYNVLFIMRDLYKNTLNDNGKTALMEATQIRDIKMVRLLGTEAKMVSIQGLTALMYAILQEYDDAVYYLAPIESSIYTSSAYYNGPGISPLELALKYNMTKYIASLS